MLGIREEPLYTDENLRAIREQMNDILQRIKDRSQQISQLVADEQIQVMEEEGDDYGRTEARLFED
jgi:hypothetical protein